MALAMACVHVAWLAAHYRPPKIWTAHTMASAQFSVDDRGVSRA